MLKRLLFIYLAIWLNIAKKKKKENKIDVDVRSDQSQPVFSNQ